MTKNNTNIPLNTEEWIAGLDGPDAEEMQEVWDLAGKSKAGANAEESEKAEVWAKMQQQIGPDKQKKSRETPIINLYSYIAAAAVMLIAVGFTIWTVWFSATTFTAPAGEMVTFVLDDQTAIEINSGSELTVKRGFASSHRTVFLLGEAYFDVAHSEIPFIVETHNAAVEVLGTRFSVRAWLDENGDETYVALESGAVSFYRNEAEAEKIELTPGQVSRLAGLQNRPTDVPNVFLDDYFAWRDRNISFTSRSFGSVLSELERRFNIRIELDQQRRQYRNRQVTAYFQQPDDPKTVLTDIAGSLGLQVESTEQNTYRVY